MEKFLIRDSFLGKLLAPLSTETFWRVEENTREQDFKKIYLLHFSDFQNEQKTISGTNFIQQDIYSSLKTHRIFHLRFRFAQTKSLNQFNDGPVKTYNS